jgi:predicted metal-dependent enzyme (double-stranded beta helix superfamily)
MTPTVLDRELDGEELLALAVDLAARPETWRGHVRHDPGRRHFHELVGTEHTVVWLICWMPGHDTGFHDHDGAGGAVTVVEGSVREERIRWAHPPAARTYDAGDAFAFGPQDIHRVTHAGTTPAITIHAYSPVPRIMGAYLPGPGGILQRHRVPEGEELRADALYAAA